MVEQYLDRSIKSPRAARSAVDLLAAMLSEQQTEQILDEGGPVSIEKDRGDALRLLASLSAWVNDVDIADAIREERERGGLMPRPPVDPVDKTKLDRDAQNDLEYALSDIGGLAEVLTELGRLAEGEQFAYLANRLLEHYRKAHNAFCVLAGLDGKGAAA